LRWGHGDSEVARADAAAAQREFERIRPAADAGGVRDADELCERSLECLDLSAEDIGSASKTRAMAASIAARCAR
jgi:hypothetical protein